MIQIQEGFLILIIMMLIVSLAFNAYTFYKWHKEINSNHKERFRLLNIMEENIQTIYNEMDSIREVFAQDRISNEDEHNPGIQEITPAYDLGKK